MKKLSRHQRERDVRRSLKHRRQLCLDKGYTADNHEHMESTGRNTKWLKNKHWLNKAKRKGLSFKVRKRDKAVTIVLPEVMNFSSQYDETALYIMAIRKLSIVPRYEKTAYKLAFVNFDNLRKISSSAALVLTAELSRWDDHIHNKLKPITDNWDTGVLKRFNELGFFDLFANNPFKDKECEYDSRVRLVRYIKGDCGKQHKVLRQEMENIVGEGITKWTFLRSGLDEAVTNVTQHAYPDNSDTQNKNWYLTGAYDTRNKEIKIVFYDQGVGIPKTLPESGIWENILGFVSKLSIGERKKDEVLLSAAMKIKRTSTMESDRGKGLPDMLEFIKQRKNGYLSILSRHGLYKYSNDDGREREKTERLNLPICGTLIIWKTVLS